MLCELRSFMLQPCGGRYLPGLHPRLALNCPILTLKSLNEMFQNKSKEDAERLRLACCA